MSNNQWNNGQADGQWQPQGNPDPNAEEQPQRSASDWDAGQGQAADWNSGAQVQGNAQDWNPAASQQDWNAQQAAGGQDWNQQPTQDWTQQQPQQGWNAQQAGADWNTGAQPQGGADWNAQPQGGAQDWHQQQPAQDWNAQPQGDWTAQQPAQDWGTQSQGGQPWNQPQGGFQGPPAFGNQPARGQRAPSARRSGNTALANVFDFSFKKFALPSAAGTIFLISVICFAIWWLVDLIQVTGAGDEFAQLPATYVLAVIFGGLARMVIGVLLTRVVIEGASAVVKLANKADADKVDEVEKA